MSRPGYHRERKSNKDNLIVDNSFIMDPTAKYEIDVAGRKVLATPHIYPPQVTTIANDPVNKQYKPKVILPLVTQAKK